MKSLLQYSQLRYLIAGGFSAAVEYCSFLLLNIIISQLVVANSISFIVGLGISFIMHKTWSFAGEQEYQTKKQLVGYFALAMANLILTNVLITILVNVLSIQPEIAKIIVMLCVVSWNYVLMKRVLFRTNS